MALKSPESLEKCYFVRRIWDGHGFIFEDVAIMYSIFLKLALRFDIFKTLLFNIFIF